MRLDPARRDAPIATASPLGAGPTGPSPDPSGEAGLLRIDAFLREIGRGRDGARGLDRATARALFDAVFGGRVGEMELGAVLIALRMKGETVDEVEGALDALHEHLIPVRTDPARPVVSIPSYNGARHAPNLVPLLACLLAGAGLQVIVHGPLRDPKRTTTAEVLRAMGLAPAIDRHDARRALDRGDPAFVPVEVLSPRLAALLALRWRLGVRNIGHTLAKLVDPTGGVLPRGRPLRLAAFTHPEFDALQHALLARSGAHALVMRATEGEVVASVKRAARIDWLRDGACETVVAAQAVAGRPVPDLPAAHDASGTALWIRSVLAGERPVPEAIASQVEAAVRAAQFAHAADGSTAGADVDTPGAPRGALSGVEA